MSDKAPPVIQSVTVVGSPVAPGGTARITIVATDADSRTEHLTGTARDTAGKTAPWGVDVIVSDPVTITVDPPSSGSVAFDPSDPTTVIFTP